MAKKGAKPASERLYRIQKKATGRRNLKEMESMDTLRPKFLTKEFILMHREKGTGF